VLEIDPGFSIASWLKMPAYGDAERARKDLEALKAAGLRE
jgi:hypothetical protein